MITIDLDVDHEKRLRELARAEGNDAVAVARRILSDYLDFHAIPAESDEAWAEASVALAAEILPSERWKKSDEHGS
jgi:hypothetical protein